MTDQWVPGPPPAPPQWSNPLPPANSWDPTAPCASGDDPSIVSGVIITGRPATISAMPWRITLNDGGAPPNFTIDHFDDAGVLIESPIVIEGSTGDVMLTHDPTEDLGAATKRYVDTTGLREAPIDNTTYGRDNGTWVPLPASYMPEAPNTSQRYGRFNSVWQLDAIQTDAPSDGAAYARQNGGWTAAVTGGPYMPISGGAFTGVVTFPSNNSVAINGALNTPHAILGQVAGLMRWQLQMPDQTAEGVGNSGANFSLSAFSTTGGFLGTWLTINRADGATTFAGTGVTIAGGLAVNALLAITNIGNLSIPGGNPGDVVTTNGSGVLSWAPRLTDAPSDGQFYTRQNAAWAVAPGGMTDAPNDGTAYARKNAAWAHLTHTDITDWTASLAPYALTTSVPVASATLPLMDGTAAAGTGATFARADHVHPSDTSRLAVAGGTITGTLGVNGVLTAGAGSGVAQILANGGAGAVRGLLAQTGGLTRWNVVANAAAETGSNNGSDFQIGRFNDAGALIDWPIAIARSTGTVVFASASPQMRNASQPQWLVADAAGTTRGQFYWQQSTNQVGIASVSPAATAVLNGSGQFQTATFYNSTATAYMAGGTLWQNTACDARIKDVQGDYTSGLDEILQLQPRIFVYKGNDTPTARLDNPPLSLDGTEAETPGPLPIAAPYPASPMYQDALDKKPYVGFIAQELERIFPNMVSKRSGFIDGEEVDDQRGLNMEELTFALVNAVKTLAARVQTLEAQLKGAT